MERKGYGRKNDIPQELLFKLNNGISETKTLVEGLSVDQMVLLSAFLKNNGRLAYFETVSKAFDDKCKTYLKCVETIGTTLYRLSEDNCDDNLEILLSDSESDIIRSWGAYFTGIKYSHDLSELFLKIRKYAADRHFGVREFAWMAVRNIIAENLEESVYILSYWADDKDENVRRFACESTRPAGVWCKHIEYLKKYPETCLPILEKLKSDDSLYVRKSVGNWLNDAGKYSPGFVIDLCKRWENEKCSSNTSYILKRAFRNIKL